MYNVRPSVVIINGINSFGLEISKRFGKSSRVLIVGKNKSANKLEFPKNVKLVDYDLFSTVKLSSIKKIVVLYHEKDDDMVSASDLVSHAKFLSEVFVIANSNKAKVILTTSLNASRHFLYSKYNDKDQPYDFPSMQNFIEKLALEQSRKTSVTILRVGDLYGLNMPKNEIIYRMVKDAVTANYVRVEEDGMERLYPLSYDAAANIIHQVFTVEFKESAKSGIFTLAPKEGITQMAFANMCIQYSTNVSYIKFIKSRNSKYQVDPVFDNVYTQAPFITNDLDSLSIENNLLMLVKNIAPEALQVLRKERVFSTRKGEDKYEKGDNKSKKRIRNSKVLNYVMSAIFVVLLIFLVFIPMFIMIVNTRLLSDSNSIFVNNYNKSTTSELAEDARFNKEKSSNLLNALSLSQWIFPVIGDDYKSNDNFLEAQRDYFEALSYSKDYNFISVPDVSRSLVQIKLQSAQSHLKSVDKNKLFWDLQDRYDDMSKIINEASL